MITLTPEQKERLSNNPLVSDEVTKMAVWPWLISDRWMTKQYFSNGLLKPFLGTKASLWFPPDPGPLQWVYDALRSIVKTMSFLPPDGKIREYKFVERLQPRNVRLALEYQKELLACAPIVDGKFVRRPLIDESELETMCYEETVRELKWLHVAKLEDFRLAVTESEPANPQGSTGTETDDDGFLMKRGKGDNYSIELPVTLDLYDEVMRVNLTRDDEISVPDKFNVYFIPLDRKDGGPKKPRFLWQGHYKPYGIEIALLQAVSAGLKTDPMHYGYYGYSAQFYLSSLPEGTIIVSSDFHRYDQSITGAVISGIVRAMCDVVGVPAPIRSFLIGYLRYGPLLFVQDGELCRIDKDGVNPSGAGLFVAINHLFAHFAIWISARLAIEKLKVKVRVHKPLVFGDDGLCGFEGKMEDVLKVLSAMKAILRSWGCTWDFDSASPIYGMFLRKHYVLIDHRWEEIADFSSKVRNFCLPERTEPVRWYQYLRGGAPLPIEVRHISALALRVQLAGMVQIHRKVGFLLGQGSECYVRMGRLIELLISKSEPYLLLELDDADLSSAYSDSRMRRKYAEYTRDCSVPTEVILRRH